MDHTARLLHTSFVTHDVKQFIVERPDGVEFEPGQGLEMAIDAEGWRDEPRPFTPTGLRDEPVLEFIIKGYPDAEGVTEKLHALAPGATLGLGSEAFGTITDHGPGTFFAAGAGVTPFLAILRERARRDDLDGCVLHFANKTPADVICEKELRHLLGPDAHFTCDQRSGPGYDDRSLDRAYLEDVLDDLDQPLYICGPPALVEGVQEALLEMGAAPDRIVREE